MISVRPYDLEMKIVRTYRALQGITTGEPGGAGHSQIRQITALAPQVSWDFHTNAMVPALSSLVHNPSCMPHYSRWPHAKKNVATPLLF